MEATSPASARRAAAASALRIAPSAAARRAFVSAASLLALGGGLLAFAGEARADVTGLRPLEPLQGFTAFSESGATVKGNEVEGSLATGGDLTIAQGAAYGVGLNNTARWTATGDARPTALYVGGRLNWLGGSIHVLNTTSSRSSTARAPTSPARAT